MLLTEFTPAEPTPEPGSVILLSSGIIGIASYIRHSHRKRHVSRASHLSESSRCV
jgi:hypothetical protein